MAGELVMLRKALVWAVVTASLVGGGAIAAEMSPQGDTWDSIKQLPDFSGVWQVGVIGPGGQIFNKPMAFTPEWQKRDRKSTRLNSSHSQQSRMPSSA